MEEKEFGKYLTPEEKRFMAQYKHFVEKYGHSSDFPVSKETNMRIYNVLKKITEKLTTEELQEFNKYCDDEYMKHFVDSQTKGDERD